jgi:hypothetical protein
MNQPSTDQLQKVRDAAHAKRALVTEFLAVQGITATNAELQQASEQLIELNATIKTLDYALGSGEVGWGRMMQRIADITPGESRAQTIKRRQSEAEARAAANAAS